MISGDGDVSTTTAVADNATSYSSYNTSDTALWTSKYAPHSFVELLSDEDSNLALLQWMKSWDPFVFRPRGTANNIPTLSGENEGQFMQFGKEVGSTATKSEKQQKPFGSSKTSTQAPSSSAAAAELLNGTAANNKAAIPARPMQRITLITGPPGAGKTTMAHIIAAHCGYDAIEVNASVDRTISTLERLISSTVADMHFVSSGMPSQKPTTGATKRGRDANAAENSHSAIKPMGLISRPRCLIIDEMDGVVANVTQLLLKQDINRPVICLANDLYAPALRDLRAVSSPLILSGSLNTFNAMMVGIMQLPPIRPQRLLHRLQIVLRKQEDEDELSYRRGLQRQHAQAAAALQKRQTADQQALSSLTTSLSLAATSSPAWHDSTRANTPATSQQQPLSSLQERISAAASTSGNSSVSPLFSNNSAPVYQSSFAHIKKHKIPLTDVLGQPLLAELVHVSNGDVRTCLNTLQFLCSSILGNNNSNKSISTHVQASQPDASANNNKSSDSSKPISSTALQRMFIDVCKKDSVMSTWSLWQQLFLRIEKSKYLQMIEKALPSGQAQEGTDSANSSESANATQRPSTTVPQQHAGNSEGSIYKDYIAREDAKRAQAKLQQYKKQQEAREAEQSKMLAMAEAEQNRLGSAGHSDHNAPKATAPPVEFPVLFSVPNAVYDPGFIYLVQHVLPLSGSQGASNSAGAGGGAMGALDMGLVLEGCYEQYPRQRYPDYNMRKTSFCSSAFSFHDLLSSQAFSGGGGGSLINLAEQFSMITAATCFVCCSSLSKADNKMQFPRMEANYRLCLKTAESVAKSFCEGGSIGPAADKANPNTTFTANRDRLNSSTTFGLHSASIIATEVAPYMCRSLLPPSAIKVPHNFSDPTRNLHAKDLENWEASVRRHAFYGLTYRPVRLPVGVNADGTSGTGLQPAFGQMSGHSGGPGSSAPGVAGGGGGFGSGFSKMSEQHGYWALEPAIDRFCLSALASGATRAPVQQPRTSNFYNKDGTKNTNFNKNDDAFNKPYTTIASASKSGTKPEANATTVTNIPSSSYTLALTQPSYNPNAAIVTKGILISRGDVRQMLVGEIGREKIRLQRAAHEQHLASLQQRQAQNPTVLSTMAAPLLDEHGFQLPAVKMERTLLFGGSSASSPPRPQTAAVAPKQQEQAPPVPVVISAPATVKVKKDFFGRPIVPKSIAPATRPATPAVEGSSADPSSAPADAPAVAVSGVNKVKAAEMAMALKYPSCMRFTYYDGSTVGVKRPANMADFIQ